MAFVCVNSGALVIAKYITNDLAPNNLVLKLYSNNATLAKSMTLASLTEVTATGYAPITLTGPWSYTQISDITTAHHPIQTFTFTSGTTIYGYFIVDTLNTLIFVQSFTDGPYTIPGLGGQTGVTPNIIVN